MDRLTEFKKAIQLGSSIDIKPKIAIYKKVVYRDKQHILQLIYKAIRAVYTDEVIDLVENKLNYIISKIDSNNPAWSENEDLYKGCTYSNLSFIFNPDGPYVYVHVVDKVIYPAGRNGFTCLISDSKVKDKIKDLNK